jgi:hypothetical protein
MTSRLISVGNSCEDDLVLTFDSHRLSCQVCQLQALFLNSAGIVISTNTWVTTGGDQMKLTKPSGATAVRLVFSLESTRANNGFFGVDNIVLRTESFTLGSAICNTADIHTAVWMAGDGRTSDPTNWCNGQLPVDRSAIIGCPSGMRRVSVEK